MNDIVRQVDRAKWRLNLEQFLRVAPWCLFLSFLAACVALAVPKIWFLPVTASAQGWQTWVGGWLGGAAAVGLLAALAITWWKRQGTYEAAVEVDRRFGLRDRVTSSLLLSDEERQTQMGAALLDDAAKRVAVVEINERFRIQTRWTAALPMVPLAGAVILTLFANAAAPQPTTVASDTAAQQAREQIRKSAEELKKRLEEQQKKAEESGLEDADELFKKLQRGVDELKAKDSLDRKTALLNLNEMAKELQQKRDGLGSAEQVKKQLEQMKSFEQGPADKFGKAMSQGDMKSAMKELSQLQKELKDGKLSDEQRQQLAKQLEQMKQQLDETVNNFKQTMDDLEKQIQQKQAAGETEAAAKLQEKLDGMKKQAQQMDKLQKMSEQLQQAAQACKEGDAAKAAESLSDLASQLEEMQSQLDQLETVDEMMNEIADAKSSMNCKQCNGEGCQQCQGKNGKSGQQGSKMGKGPPGRGLGKGRGAGERPEEDVDGRFYDTKAKTKLRQGEAVRTGFADGPNIAGKSVDAVRQEVSEALQSDPDPLPDQVLTKGQREQATQFFQGVGKGASSK
ncbi:MAG: hypothetical protein U1A77_16915 [Pirellulales bacterium]